MSEDPWTILGLDPETADQRAVKSAYASLLKANRPDDDEEAFKRIYNAYQTALSSVLKDVVPVPAREQERHSRGDEDDAAPSDRLLPLVELINALKHGDTDPVHTFLFRTMLDDPQEERVLLAQAILDEPESTIHGDTLEAVCHLATDLRLVRRGLTGRLIDEVYRIAPPRERDRLIFHPSHLEAHAGLLEKLPAEDDGFWSVALLHPEDIDWDSPRAVQALRKIRGLGGWYGYYYLEQILPPKQQIWKRNLWHILNRRWPWHPFQKKWALTALGILAAFPFLFAGALFLFSSSFRASFGAKEPTYSQPKMTQTQVIGQAIVHVQELKRKGVWRETRVLKVHLRDPELRMIAAEVLQQELPEVSPVDPALLEITDFVFRDEDVVEFTPRQWEDWSTLVRERTEHESAQPVP